MPARAWWIGGIVAAVAAGVPPSCGRAASAEAVLESPALVLKVEAGGGMQLEDKRSGRRWSQAPAEKGATVLLERVERLSATALRLHLGVQQTKFTAGVSLVAEGTEVEFALEGGGMPERLRYPPAFLPDPDASLILALKEGLWVPVRDTTIFFESQKRGTFSFFEGHNASMPFWGFANGDGSGLMALVLTPNDAEFRIFRCNDLLTDQVVWRPEFGRFGYARRIRFIPVTEGGYVAMARRYRVQAEQDGLVKTLREKIRENPQVERLLGAADVWLSDFKHEMKDSSRVAAELQQLGVERALFAGGGGWWTQMTEEEITAVNALGYLSNRYDCLQDVMAPENFEKISGVNPLYRQLQKAWPDDVVLQADGTFFKGWPVGGKDGQTYHCGRLSDQVRLQYARELVPRDLDGKPYRARFLDTEAATAWTEDYNPRHHGTRSGARRARMEVLGFLSRDCRLITGSEGLSAYAVPQVHYFEGVGPIEPFRVPQPGEHPFRTFPADYDWGDGMTRLLEGSHRYLVPLWQLVFHDCVVTYPRWNEANNKYAHPLWSAKQALFCALNGRPPIFMFNLSWWGEPENRRLLAEIYRKTGPLAQEVGLARMTDHRWLDAVGDVQQTRFDNGVTVTVNFAREPRELPGRAPLRPLSVEVHGVVRDSGAGRN